MAMVAAACLRAYVKTGAPRRTHRHADGGAARQRRLQLEGDAIGDLRLAFAFELQLDARAELSTKLFCDPFREHDVMTPPLHARGCWL